MHKVIWQFDIWRCVVITKILSTDLNCSQTDYLDMQDLRASRATAGLYRSTGRYLKNIISECIALSTVLMQPEHAVYLAWRTHTICLTSYSNKT